MKDVLAITSSLLLGMALLMLGAGLQGTLIGVRATLEEFPTVVIGAVMACYYVGYLAGSLMAPRLVQRVGHVRVFAALSSLASASILLQGMFVNALSWGLLRAVSGLCFAGIYVVAESWLNDRADNRTRARLLGVYMAVIYVGLGAGQFLLNVDDPRTNTLFVLIAVLISLAVIPMSLSAQRAPELTVPQPVRLGDLFRLSPLGVIAVLFSGAASGTVFALGPVYAAGAYAMSGVSAFMAFSIFIAVLAQLPLGRLSDRLDRRTVLSGISLVAALAAGASFVLAAAPGAAFFAAAVLSSGLSLTIYSLAVSHINDHLLPAQMVDASGTLILVNGVGAVIGPLLVAAAMQWSGSSAYFAALAIMHVVFAVYTLWRKQRREPVADEEKKRFVAAQPQTTPAGQLSTSTQATEPPARA
jgi:MFS family permease